MDDSSDPGTLPEREEAEKTYRQVCFEQVKELQAQGCTQREVARRLRIARQTVAKYFRLEAPPRRALQNSTHSKVLPYLDFLQKRWAEGCHNLKALLGELQTRGFTGSYASLSRAVHGRLGVGNLELSKLPAAKPVVFSPRQAAWCLLRPEDRLREQQKTFRQALCDVSEAAGKAYTLAQSFREMIENRQVEKLDAWLHQAEGSQIMEFERFALSLRSDFAAVRAALLYSWSNGQVEGQVNRLKLIKRQIVRRVTHKHIAPARSQDSEVYLGVI